MTISQIYNKSGLMYIRYDGKIEDRGYGQKQIAGRRQTYTMMNQQLENKPGGCKFYSLLMGREFKPDQYAILLDFENKVEGDTKNGQIQLAKLILDQHDAPKQHTPSSGLH